MKSARAQAARFTVHRRRAGPDCLLRATRRARRKLAKARERQLLSLLDLRCVGGLHLHHGPSSIVQYSAVRSSLRSETYRITVCQRCRVQLLLCAGCDKGRRFCAHCRPAQRRDSMRRAGGQYRIKPRSKRLHAARQARYRDRRSKFSDQKVTHHPVTQAPGGASSLVSPEVVSGGKDQDEDPGNALARCSFCNEPLPVWGLREPHHSRVVRRRSPRLPRGPPRRR